MRCSESTCRYSETTALPQLQKSVIYLDQNAFSALFNFRSRGRLPKGHEKFCEEFERLSQRALLLQQAIFPHSDIHHGETIVFHEAQALREMYESMGGECRFLDTHDIEILQTTELANAALESRAPEFSFEADEVLARPKDRWLRDMRISVVMDYSRFAEARRLSRDRAHKQMERLVEYWRSEKPDFAKVLESERRAFGATKVRMFFEALRAYEKACAQGDIDGMLNSSLSQILTEHKAIEQAFIAAGAPREKASSIVLDFWSSMNVANHPQQDLEAHLFAALAGRVAQDQRSFTRGLLNDVRAISTYAPYVDAMFVDKEFEVLLKETPALRRLPLRSRIFSFKSTDDFLTYLGELCESATEEVAEYASKIYGIGKT